MTYYDRYREALGKPVNQRTDALIAGVSQLARSQARTEYQILSNLDPVIDGELQELLNQPQSARTEPVTKWDLVRSQQLQRLLMFRLIGDLRSMLIGVLCLMIGTAIGSIGTIAFIKHQSLQPVQPTEVSPWQ